ncbi:F0F1 ATP synthase subunit gamma [Nakamurella multipartita]|jgi:F-type H+-transporting ATPase subunit gamma|uniref:ATP synthase gamma chain n=1 Tax=Nakamurella multipartita (strain ATCC 700099 / DSM 44233 / CIP 104796 / JCM 9543 / NBRC 105858 / Y-104) TaxID=479431 RepID=C8XID4_NAKMY|nr:F0F1 ATP synthase subunit gamma [Nakamurella multipartita]ACV78503.1 ATP synthase F1, gamma subunit [Nakamurella multipartita DSM 44233]HOZ58563.1 F0F1 ATP synthase subunit gamma [Nakamurella multipartita]
MAAQVRVLRQRVKSVKSTQKITKAQEMIATSRIAKAQAKVAAAAPYSRQITQVLSSLASASTLDHPLLNERDDAKRAGILLITADRGLCGGYNAMAIKAAEELAALLRSQGKESVLYVIGRKGVGYYTFRNRPLAATWTGFSERPTYAHAEAATEAILPSFLAGSAGQSSDGQPGIDEIHLVSTHFVSMITQRPQARRMAPMEIEYVERDEATPLLPAYEFEPSSDQLLDEMLPKYLKTRIYAALLDAAASESAARRAACKAATDNANDIIRNLSRQANQARQAQITQELTEIVGGADALAALGNEED